ncbi:MAG: Gldg family protein [Flavobacteriales bacterium]|nr:Gldg family protein [Flavobacteriales bacterium]
MRKTWTIARKELAGFFDSLIAYVLLALFLGFCGFLTWMWPSGNVFVSGTASLGAFWAAAYWALFIFVPLLTMRALAEERRSGTLDLLLTKAVTDWQIVFGKFLASVVLITVALVCTLPYWASIAYLGPADHGAIACGYLALLLMSAAYIAIGIWASSLTNNQVVSALIALVVIFFFHFLFGFVVEGESGMLALVLQRLSTDAHFASMSRGVIDSRDLLYFTSIILVALALAEANLAKRSAVRNRGRVLRFTLAICIAVVMVNVLGDRFKFRVDLTDDGRYTLSPATRNMLQALPEPVTVTAYYSEELPAQYAAVREEFRDLLAEFHDAADGNLVYEFVDPGTDGTRLEEAKNAGVRAVQVNIPQKDKFEQMIAYMSASVKMGERSDLLEVVQGGSMEHTLGMSVKKVSIDKKPTIGFVQGHGEPSIGEMGEVYQSLDVLYEIATIPLPDSLSLPDRFAALLIVDPVDSFPEHHLRVLDEMLARGRPILIAYSGLINDLGSTPLVGARQSNLTTWLASKGVDVQPTILIDQLCGQVQIRQQRGDIPFVVSIPFPYFPMSRSFADHAITKGLESVLMQFCSPLARSQRSDVAFTPLVLSSEHSAALQPPHVIDPQRQWGLADFPLTGQAMAAAVEGPLAGPTLARMVVFGNGRFAVNGAQGQQQQLNPDNINVFVNAVDWLVDDTGLIELRTKQVNFRPLNTVSDGVRNTLKWANLVLPILAAFIYGMLRAAWRRRQRSRRMQPGHVQ